MILLTTPSARAADCAAAIETGTDQKVQHAEALHETIGLLRSHEYSVVVVDQSMLEADPDQAEVVLQHTGNAVVLHVNCAILGVERMVREVRAALGRRENEVRAARLEAEQSLRSDLREPLTALLLQCDLALSLSSLSAAAKDKLHNIHDLAWKIQEQLHDPVLSGE